MKTLLVCLLVLIGCSRPLIKPSHKTVSSDVIADGKVRAIAQKQSNLKTTCFEISLRMEADQKEYAEASNWTMAWVDSNQRYHLLNLQERSPASLVKSSNGIWTNSFKACDNKSKLDALDSLLLTPKTFPFRESEGLKFQWK